jgi:DNA-binding IclR family transcriptional regulator
MNNEKTMLTRGIAVLELLNREPGLGLEQIRKKTQIPKTSLYRIMQILVSEQLAIRDVHTCYRPLIKIQLLSECVFEQTLRRGMSCLAAATNQTVEWYEPREAGLVITMRALPAESEIGVQARIGFIRAWNEELDAVLALGIAHLKPESTSVDLGSLEAYLEPFHRRRISAEFAKSRIMQAGKEGLAYDRIANGNNVRRAAALIKREGCPVGIMAIAEVVHPARPDDIEELQERLAEKTMALQRNLQ